jgi:hypothetical protein
VKRTTTARVAGFLTVAGIFCLGVVGSAAAVSPTDLDLQVGVVSIPQEFPRDTVQLVGSSVADVRITVVLTGLLPNSWVEIYAHSEPVLLASGYADENGEFNVTVSLPADIPPGDHTIQAEGTTPEGTPFVSTVADLTVTETGTIAPGATGDGSLALSGPANPISSLATTLVEGRSTSTGELGDITVIDQRVVAKPGWKLYADVSNFVLSSDSSVAIPKENLATSPRIVSAQTVATGISVASPTLPGTSVYPLIFAQADAGASEVGVSVFNADLKLVAPGQFPAGRYTATYTLTLVSG